MIFAVAVKGIEVAKNIDACEKYIIYEEKNGRIIMRQSIEKPEASSLSVFIDKVKVKAILCNNFNEEEKILLHNSEIEEITKYSGDSNNIADKFALESNKKKANLKACLQPMPKVLVSCRGLDGENNVLAVGYCGNCSYAPPMVMVGIVPSRYSYKMIKNQAVLL